MRCQVRSVFAPLSRRSLTLTLFALLAGCDPMSLALEGSCLMCITPSPPVVFAVSPDSANMLRGDTVTLNAWKCLEPCVFNQEPVVANWTITGDALTPVHPTALTQTSRVLFRAAALGESMITAVAPGDDTKRQTVRVFVADSSAITSIAMQPCCSGGDTVVTYGWVSAYLKDQEGRRYRARVTSWSVSDNTMITLADPGNNTPGEKSIRVHKAGTVEIRTTFRNVEGRLQLVVRP